MDIKTVDYELIRGDTTPMKKIKIEFSGENIDPNNFNLFFTVKRNKNSKAVIQKSINNGITLGEDGYYHLILENEDTYNLSYGEYQYDIEFKSGKYRKTLVNGTITLNDEITTNKEEY